MKLKELVDRVVADGIITPEEHKEFVDFVCNDPALTDEERREIGRLRDLIARGEVRFATPADDSE